MTPDAFDLPPERDTPADRALRRGEASPFPYPARPTEADLRRRLAAVRAQPIDRAGLSARLLRLHERLEAPRRSLEAAAAVARGDAFLVVAGQQPAPLGGPLYVLHKIATAVSVARAWSRLGVGSFLPAYWVASDDHDPAEVSRLRTQGAEGGPREWRLDMPDEGLPAHRVPAGARAAEWTREVLSSLGARGEAWIGRMAPRPEWSLAEWHARGILSWFAEEGLLVIEPSEALWGASGDAFSRLLSAWPEAAEGVERAAADLARRGWERPVPRREEVPFFHLEKGRRRVPARAAGEIRPWAERAVRESALFSPDVLARVALQDALLPVAAQVVGPHEASYLPLSAPLHAALGCEMPPAVPRISATWISEGQAAFLSRTGLSVGSLWEGKVAYEQAVAAAVPPEIAMHLAGVDEAFDGAISRLADVGLSLDPQMEGAFRKGRERIDQEVARLRRKVIGASLARAGLGLGDWERLRGWVSPGGKLQERVFSGMETMARYGDEAVHEALRAADPFDFRHRLLVAREVR